MRVPQTLSLPVLPESHFGRLQVTTYLDGCIVVTILQDEETDCLLHPGSKAFVAKAVQIGLTEEDSTRLRRFLAARPGTPVEGST